MQATLPLHSSDLTAHTPVALQSSAVSVEIHAYLATRNLLLRGAEENPTETNLRRAASANDFAEECLRPARSPYQAQALPEAEAIRERKCCQAVRVRLAELRGRFGLRRRAA